MRSRFQLLGKQFAYPLEQLDDANLNNSVQVLILLGVEIQDLGKSRSRLERRLMDRELGPGKPGYGVSLEYSTVDPTQVNDKLSEKLA